MGNGNWWGGNGGSSDAYPVNGTAAEQSKWLKDHGFGTGQNTGPNNLLPPGWVINPRTGGLIPPGDGPTGGGGIPIGGFFDVNGTVYQWNGHGSLVQASVGETKVYWGKHPNGLSYDPSYGLLDASTGRANTYGGGSPGGSGGGGSTQRLTTDDPRYWDLEYAKLGQDEQQFVRTLAYQYAKAGMDSETARRQALTQWVQMRDSLASNTAQTSADVAKQAAQFAANPRDTYAEALYKNQVGGATPFGDINNSAFGEYGKALANKVTSTFQDVNADLNKSRQYRDAIPPLDFLSGDQRSQIAAGGNPPAPVNMNGLQSFAGASQAALDAINRIAWMRAAGQPAAGGGASPAAPSSAAATNAAPAPETSPQSAAAKYIRSFAGQGQPGWKLDAMGRPIDPNAPLPTVPSEITGTRGTGYTPGAVQFAQGGQIDFGGIFDNRDQPGFSPSSSEGGTSLNLHERALVVGESGHVYATLGEKRPDGTVRAEQLQIKPLKSEVAKDKKLEEGHKAIVETQKQTMKSFAGGGSVNSPSMDEMSDQYAKLLARLGGPGGGSSTPLGGARFLAGAPADAIQSDPYLKGITDASYSIRGIDPAELWAQVAKFQIPGVVNNSPRISWA